MKITFVRLNMFEHISSDAMKPLLFGIIKSLTPTEDEIEFIDERVEKLPERIDADIIAFSVETFTAKRAYILSKKYKTDKNVIVMGGFHASVMAEEMLQYADTVLIGDAEETWAPFLEDCRNKDVWLLSAFCVGQVCCKPDFFFVSVYLDKSVGGRMRLIDADKMKENCRITGELMNHFECVSLATLGEVIDAQPTIDTMKRGKWIMDFLSGYRRKHYKCSVCRKRSANVSFYCPNCGAKMDKEG